MSAWFVSTGPPASSSSYLLLVVVVVVVVVLWPSGWVPIPSALQVTRVLAGLTRPGVHPRHPHLLLADPKERIHPCCKCLRRGETAPSASNLRPTRHASPTSASWRPQRAAWGERRVPGLGALTGQPTQANWAQRACRQPAGLLQLKHAIRELDAPPSPRLSPNPIYPRSRLGRTRKRVLRPPAGPRRDPSGGYRGGAGARAPPFFPPQIKLFSM